MMRKSSLLLSALLLFGTLASCGEAASAPPASVTDAPDTAEAVTEPEETDPLSYLPAEDFGGRTFACVCVRSTSATSHRATPNMITAAIWSAGRQMQTAWT